MAKSLHRIILSLLLCGLHLIGVSQISLEESYRSQVGVREVPRGANWGPQVQKYLAACGIFKPSSWCACFVKWNFDQAGIKTTINAWSPTAHNKRNLVYFKGQLLKEPQSGDVFTLWYTRLGRIAHTGFFDRKVNSSLYLTVEGNTNEAGSREGDGVYRKYRSYRATYSISRWR